MKQGIKKKSSWESSKQLSSLEQESRELQENGLWWD